MASKTAVMLSSVIGLSMLTSTSSMIERAPRRRSTSLATEAGSLWLDILGCPHQGEDGLVSLDAVVRPQHIVAPVLVERSRHPEQDVVCAAQFHRCAELLAQLDLSWAELDLFRGLGSWHGTLLWFETRWMRTSFYTSRCCYVWATLINAAVV